MDEKTLLLCLRRVTQNTNIKNSQWITVQKFNKLQVTQNTIPSIYCVYYSKHWFLVHLFNDKKNLCANIIDSYGNNPISSYSLEMPTNVKLSFINTRKLQSETSNICGMFCIYFAFYLARGSNLHLILTQLPSQIHLCEQKIIYFFTRLRRLIKIKKPELVSVPSDINLL